MNDSLLDPVVESIKEPSALVFTKEQFEALKLEKDRRNTIASYYKYVLKCRPDLKPTHLHQVLANKIQNFLERPGRSDGTEFLLISLPFQTGKTTWGAQSIPSWYMLKHPGVNCIIISYSAAFASKA